ncbi:unnamed protein product [Trichobilharzia regenti]|nr:unnamed protein product [Trichobilharzia regenti]
MTASDSVNWGYKGRPNAFIATQGVMPHTINDFWRMIWYSHTPAIVMITKLVENKEVSLFIYLLTFYV